eukprot:3106374-Prymnesium_polylepis.1
MKCKDTQAHGHGSGAREVRVLRARSPGQPHLKPHESRVTQLSHGAGRQVHGGSRRGLRGRMLGSPKGSNVVGHDLARCTHRRQSLL